MLNLTWGSFHNDPITYIPEEREAALVSSLPEGYILFSIDGKDINSESELLNRISRAMKFPSYFGHNWNALKDCISDLAWIPAKGYVILFSNADSFVKNYPHDFKVFSEIIKMVSEFWAEQQVEFILIIETKDEPN
jgi:RNAse (barnase) inhibitor barstar